MSSAPVAVQNFRSESTLVGDVRVGLDGRGFWVTTLRGEQGETLYESKTAGFPLTLGPAAPPVDPRVLLEACVIDLFELVHARAASPDALQPAVQRHFVAKARADLGYELPHPPDTPPLGEDAMQWGFRNVGVLTDVATQIIVQRDHARQQELGIEVS